MRFLFLLLIACGPGAVPGPQARMTLEQGPFPWIDYPDGVRDPAGFGINGITYFAFDTALNPATLQSAVKFMRLSEDGEPQADIPFSVAWSKTGNYVVITPDQPLMPSALHAVVITDVARGSDGKSLSTPELLEQLKAGKAAPQALQDRFNLLWKKVDRGPVRAATVYRSGNPLQDSRSLAAYVRNKTPPATSGLFLALNDPMFCVVQGEVTLPFFQAGQKPYSTSGGEIVVDSAGRPQTELTEQVRFALSIPHGVAPVEGYPLVIFSHGLNANYYQFVEKGVAQTFAVSKFAVLSADAPLFGPRHPQGDISGVDFLASKNPVAARDNVRQLAMDAVALAQVPTSLVVPAGLCDPTESRLNGDRVFFFGHQVGAQAGVIALTVSTEIRAAMFSGFSTDLFGEFDEARQRTRLITEPTDPLLWARTWAKPTLVNQDKDYIESLKTASPTTTFSAFPAPAGVTGAVFFDQPKAESAYRCFFEAVSRGEAPMCPLLPQ